MAMEPKATVIVIVAIPTTTLDRVGRVGSNVIDWDGGIRVHRLAQNLSSVDKDLKVKLDTRYRTVSTCLYRSHHHTETCKLTDNGRGELSFAYRNETKYFPGIGASTFHST